MRKSILMVLIILMLGGLTQIPTMANTQEGWQWSIIDVLSTESTWDSDYSSMATDPFDNIHVVWQDSTNYDGSGSDPDIFYKYLNDTTQIWSTTEVISTDSTGDSYSPKIACDILGNVHIIWNEYADYDSSGTDSDILYKKLEMYNQTWSNTEVISTDSTEHSTQPSLAIDNSNNIHLVWQDYTNYDGSGSDVDIFYKYFNSNTQSWLSTVVISTESTSTSRDPEISVDSMGNIFVVWSDYTDYDDSNTDIDIFFKRLNYRLQEWGVTELISTESTTDSWFSAISVDKNDNIHVIWFDSTDYLNSGLDHDIAYRNFDTYRQSWTDTEVVSTESDYSSTYPAIACDSNGIHVVWGDQSQLNGADQTTTDIFHKYRAFDEKAWYTVTNVLTVGSAYSQLPQIAVDNSQYLHLIWTDATDYNNSGTDKDIFYTKLSGTPETPVLGEIQPNPSNGIVDLVWNDVFSARSYSVYRDIYPIHSIEGLTPIAETTETYYVDEIDAGTYYYAITANNPEGSSLSNTVYVQIEENYNSVITEYATSILNGSGTDEGFVDFPVSIPLLFGSITLIMLVQRKRKY